MAISAGEVEVRLVMDPSGLESGLNKAKDSMRGFGDQAELTATTTQEAGKKIGTASEEAGAKVVKSSSSSTMGMKDLGLGMSQTATSAFGLYRSFDDLEKKQYLVEKATLAAQRADVNATKAKQDYDEAVTKYGADSDQAKMALDKLNIATDAAALADEKVTLNQKGLNDSMMMAGLTIIPSVISGFEGLTKVWKSFSGFDFTGTFGKLKDGLQGLGNDKIGLLAGVALGVGTIVTIFAAWGAKTPEEKNNMSMLAAVMGGLTGAQWGLNIAQAFGWGLTGVGLAVVATAITGAGLAYAAAQSYGVSNVTAPDKSLANPSGDTDTASGTGGGADKTTYGGSYTSKEQRQEQSSQQNASGFYDSPPAGLLFDWSTQVGVYKIPGAELYGGAEELRFTAGHDLPEMTTPFEREAWKRRRDPDTGFIKNMSQDNRGDLWEDKGNAGVKFYGQGGWAGLNGPEMAVLGDAGKPELVLTVDHVKALGSGSSPTIIYNTINVDGSRDVDLVMSALVRELRPKRSSLQDEIFLKE